MEPKPPRKSKAETRAFYDLPDHVPTSAKIISEARSSLRTVKTKRPFTPRQDERTLFGKSSCRAPENRPPSAFSLGSRHFDGSESRPTSGVRPVSGTRLTPLQSQSVSSDIDNDVSPKPPADPNRPIRRKSSKTRLAQQPLVDSSPEVVRQRARSKSGSLSDVSIVSSDDTDKIASVVESSRRAHSGPTARTYHSDVLVVRGLGDGKEIELRPPNAVLTRSSSGSDITNKTRPDSGYTTENHLQGSAISRQGSGGHNKGGQRAESSGTKEDETPEESLYYNKHIGPIVEKMVVLDKDQDGDKVVDLSNQLYEALEKGQLLGRECKRRSTILKTIFRFLDTDTAKHFVSIGRLILALKVSGNNLNSVCKLLFRVGKDERNDTLFAEGNVLELMLDTAKVTSPSQACDALVYCVGAIKCLSGNTMLAKKLSAQGCIESMADVMSNVESVISESNKASQSLSNILVQVTHTLRNLADISSNRPLFLHLSIIGKLVKVTEWFPGDYDLMLNSTRLLSKLTMHSDCCSELIIQPHIFKNLLYLLIKHIKKPDLVIRTCFVLGNITAKSDEARIQLFSENKCFETIKLVFKTYLDPEIQASQTVRLESSEQLPTNEDVLIKLIRVIANLSINEHIGPNLSASHTLVDWLMQIIHIKDVSTSEELVLNTVATINNLSYYHVKDGAIVKKQLQLANSLLKLMSAEDMEGMVEASRVFGNLTRQKPVRDLLAKNKVNEIMVALLDSGSREVVYTACGVLINLMADEEKRSTLKIEGGVKKLIDVLRDFGRNDWQLAGMVCQILWNYSVKLKSSNACFGDQETTDLVEILVEYLDEDAALEASLSEDADEEMREYLRDNWEAEFCPVAAQLLSKVEDHQSDFEPLDPPTSQLNNSLESPGL